MDYHTYDLAFLSAKEAGRDDPEIVFIIAEKYLDLLYERLAIINPLYMFAAHTYFNGHTESFVSPKTDLFGGFGYGDCGYVTTQDEDVWLHIPLGRDNRMLEAAYTINVLSTTLLVPFEEAPGSNSDQQVSLETLADMHSTAGWGHMIGGYVGPSLIRWLQRYGENNKDGASTFWSSPLPPEVLKAMQIAWKSLTVGVQCKFADEIHGRISHEGRFLMQCFGNACDICIYPDQWIHDDCEHVRFACHNLDCADQQLTLIAGLAKLCELARQNT